MNNEPKIYNSWGGHALDPWDTMEVTDEIFQELCRKRTKTLGNVNSVRKDSSAGQKSKKKPNTLKQPPQELLKPKLTSLNDSYPNLAGVAIQAWWRPTKKEK
jgi:hypothetical protein